MYRFVSFSQHNHVDEREKKKYDRTFLVSCNKADPCYKLNESSF